MRAVARLLFLLSALSAACGGDDDGAGHGDPDAGGPPADAAAPDPDATAAVHYPGPCRLDLDNGADGQIDDRRLYAYDAQGNMILEERVVPDDRSVFARATYDWNADGRVVAATYDSDTSTEVLDSRDTYTYDENGNLTLVESKLLDGDTVDARTTQTFDEMNRRTLVEFDYDTAAVGLDRVDSYDYMADRFVWEIDQGDDDVINDRFTHIHGDDDLVDREENDRMADGDIDEVYQHTYDDQGRVIEDDDDGDNDSVFEYKTTYSYNSFGLSFEDYDDGGDGDSDSHLTYTYDDAGNLLLRERDDGPDDVIDWRATYFYDCE